MAREFARSRSFVADPDNAPRWYANIRSVEWRSEPPLRLGSRIAFVAHYSNRMVRDSWSMLD
jgi:hypothetical protein